ncbi:MAG: amidase, partial [Alphaproteobacteria bacterium]
MTIDDPTRLGALEAAAAIARGELTSVALTQACLDRIQSREDVGAWVVVDADRALAEAAARDAESPRSPLHGVPFGVKDIIDVVGLPTGMGSPIYADAPPAHADAAAVALARYAGLVPLGKTVTTEFALRTAGKTRNPHRLTHSPGGSSSGSAAAVADFQVPLAIGTQTGGSVIRPASYCGVVGYKPTFGRISRAGVKSVSESLDTVGVFARAVADAAAFAAVLEGAAESPARLKP